MRTLNQQAAAADGAPYTSNPLASDDRRKLIGRIATGRLNIPCKRAVDVEVGQQTAHMTAIKEVVRYARKHVRIDWPQGPRIVKHRQAFGPSLDYLALHHFMGEPNRKRGVGVMSVPNAHPKHAMVLDAKTGELAHAVEL